MGLTRTFIVGLLLTGYFCIAEAQVAPVVPGTLDPSRIGQSLSRQIEVLKPKSEEKIKLPGSDAPEIPEALTKIKFKLRGITIEGNTVVSSEELAKEYESLIGKEITIVDLFNLREDLVSAYRKKGYILVKVVIPQQSFDMKNARIKFTIIEGFVENIEIKGDANPRAKALLRRYAEQVKKSKPLKLKAMERYALLSNDLPGLDVNYVLSPSKSTQGGADLVVNTKVDKKIVGQIGYNNFGTVFIGPQQLFGSLVFNMPAGLIDQFSLYALGTTDISRLQFLQLSNNHRFGPYGTSFDVFASRTRTFPGARLRDLDIRGYSSNVSLSIKHPILRTRTKNLYGNLYFDLLDNESRSKAFALQIYKDHIRSVRAALFYDEVRWKGVNLISLRVSHGLNALGARLDSTRDIPLSRPNGRADYFKLDGDLTRTQYISEHFSYYGALHWQTAFHPLLTAEQIGFGGPIFGRGYENSEILGDSGVSVANEIRILTRPSLKMIKTLMYFGFYDAGVVWNDDRNNFPRRLSRKSIGLGLRANLFDHVSIEFYGAKPLGRGILSRDLDRDMRYLLNIVIVN